MTDTCLNCGKPLGGRSTLCFSCESEGASVSLDLEADDEIVDRVERYLVVATTKCSDCDGLHGTVTVDGETYTAADFGIDSLEEWALEMENEETWMRENRREVERALAVLEDEWPQSVSAVRTHVL